MIRDAAPEEEGRVLTDILNNLPQGVMLLSAGGDVVGCHGAIEYILKKSRNHLINNNLSELGEFGQVGLDLLSRIKGQMGQVSLLSYEIDSINDSGPIDIQLQRLNDLEPVTYMLVVHAAAQPAAEATESLNGRMMLDHMSAALAHEIRNPLAGVRAAAQLSAKHLPDDKAHLSSLIVSETDRLSKLVDQLERMTAHRADQLSPVNIHEALDHVAALVSSKLDDGHQIERWYDPSLPNAATDHEGLVQVILNLVQNALQAGKDRPLTLKIHSRYHHGFRVTMSDGVVRDLPIEIEIEDNGPGVDPEIESVLFEPFITTKEAGKGLGLALVAMLVSDMKGHVRYEKVSPNGSRFFVNLSVSGE